MLIRHHLAAIAAAVLLVACGGGDPAPTVSYDKLVSFGDSLSDVGTFKVGTIAAATATGGGGRWVTSGPAGGEIWTELLAQEIKVAKPCPAETGLLPNIPGITGAAVMAKPGCFSYAQGSARITSTYGPNSVALQALPDANSGGALTQTLGLMAKPIASQMAAHLSAPGGNYRGNELVTVLAGGNDVFMELAFIGTALGGADAAGAVANMTASGTRLGALIKTEVLAKGATRVLVLNIPDVAATPYAKGLGPQTAGLIDTMVKAFNTALATELNGVTGIRLADAYATSKDQAANMAKYGLSNVTDVACGPNALSSSPAVNGSALVCNGSNLVAGDTSRYQFADDVHPTAYGHELLKQFAVRELRAAGWL